MKRWIAVLMIICLLGLGACARTAEEETMHMGLNAVVVEIDAENAVLYVRDADKESEIFGENCALSCENYIYVDYESGELEQIGLEDLQVGDSLIITLTGAEKEHAKEHAAVAEQVQLGTQRMN